ncbi:MAG TPA: hypothetical protein ENJ54_05155 [Chloroflexi bacterium]|nr:hypothetical protein [Chloroflexota bacterium]
MPEEPFSAPQNTSEAPETPAPAAGATPSPAVATPPAAETNPEAGAAPASAPELPPAAEGQPAEPPQSKPPSKARRFLRRLWRWTLVVLVVFGLGFVAATWRLYVPARNAARQAQAQAQQAAQQVQDLQTQLQQVQSQRDALQEEVESAQQASDRAMLEAALSDALAEAYAVRLALKDEDATGASLHAEALGRALQALQQKTPTAHRDLVAQMQKQAADIQANLDSPGYADRQLRALIQHLQALKEVVLSP